MNKMFVVRLIGDFGVNSFGELVRRSVDIVIYGIEYFSFI